MVIGEFSPNYRKYAISYLSILFNNSALQFCCTVHRRLLRTPLASPSPSECHSGVYEGRECTEDIEALSTLVGCSSSLIILEDPGLEIFVSLSCFFPGWDGSLCRAPVSLKQFIRLFKRNSILSGLMDVKSVAFKDK